MKISEIVNPKPVKPHTVWRRGGSDETPEYFLERADVLYHGTTLTRAKQILQQGIKPNLGEFIRYIYSRAKVAPVVIAADANFKKNILNAIRFHLALELYQSADSVYEVTIPQLLQHGAVVEIKTDRSKFQQSNAMHKPQRGIERFDYYAFKPVQADRIITGRDLLEFFGEPLLLSYFQYDTPYHSPEGAVL